MSENPLESYSQRNNTVSNRDAQAYLNGDFNYTVLYKAEVTFPNDQPFTIAVYELHDGNYLAQDGGHDSWFYFGTIPDKYVLQHFFEVSDYGVAEEIVTVSVNKLGIPLSQVATGNTDYHWD